jgi:DNA-binding NarL/FixJ family response regulator
MEPTRVFVLADTVKQAHKLAGTFAGSRDFRIAGVTTIRDRNRLLQAADADVVVIRSPDTTVELQLAAPVLWVGRVSLNHRHTDHLDASLAGDATPGQIRAAVLALAAGLQLEPWAKPVDPRQSDSEVDFLFAEPLTDRELEVLNLVAEGLSNPQIAKRLKVSRNTVKFHLSSIMGKLEANSRTEAVTLGLRRGLIIV